MGGGIEHMGGGIPKIGRCLFGFPLKARLKKDSTPQKRHRIVLVSALGTAARFPGKALQQKLDTLLPETKGHVFELALPLCSEPARTPPFHGSASPSDASPLACSEEFVPNLRDL